ncbi:unnamed protein product [Sphagnum jensenii]|uniref:Secreted protein n=1 Tax=Sphagnum jensenii TaxID=128206 RepID=A0ABP1BYF3_9BRYO
MLLCFARALFVATTVKLALLLASTPISSVCQNRERLLISIEAWKKGTVLVGVERRLQKFHEQQFVAQLLASG